MKRERGRGRRRRRERAKKGGREAALLTQQQQLQVSTNVDVVGDGCVNFKLIALQLHYFACLSMREKEREIECESKRGGGERLL